MPQAPTPLEVVQEAGRQLHTRTKASNGLRTLAPEIAGSLVTDLDNALEQLAIEMAKAADTSSPVRLPSDISGKIRTAKSVGRQIESGTKGQSRYPAGSTETYIDAYIAKAAADIGLPASALGI